MLEPVSDPHGHLVLGEAVPEAVENRGGSVRPRPFPASGTLQRFQPFPVEPAQLGRHCGSGAEGLTEGAVPGALVAPEPADQLHPVEVA